MPSPAMLLRRAAAAAALVPHYSLLDQLRLLLALLPFCANSAHAVCDVTGLGCRSHGCVGELPGAGDPLHRPNSAPSAPHC